MDDDLGDLRQDFEVAAKWLGISIVLVLLLAVGSVAFAAPRAENEQECPVAADMAVVARALAEEKLAAPKAELIMRRIYNISPLRGEELLQTIIEAAYRKVEPAGEFASKLYAACMVTGGNMDAILGVKL